MRQARSEDVRQLYENYPFPHGTTTTGPDFLYSSSWLIHFNPGALSGCRVLDAGCGTGNKLIALATMYPTAHFVGVDLSEQSIEVARKLAAKYKRANVELRQGNLMELGQDEKYDVIQAVGVVHHLEDPQQGLQNLCNALNENGILLIWLYHPLGEFDRLNKREMLLTLWGDDRGDLAEGEMLMEELGLDLEPGHYGPREKASDDLEGKADAFMHPIVNAYRLAEAFDMFRAAGNDWAAVDFLNMKGALRFVNLEEVDDPIVGKLCVRHADLLQSQPLQERFSHLSKEARLKIIELALQPRGYLVLAGRRDSFTRFGKRILGNLIKLS